DALQIARGRRITSRSLCSATAWIARKGHLCLVSSTCTMDILLNSSHTCILIQGFNPHSKSSSSSLLTNKLRQSLFIRIFSGRLMDTPLRCSSAQQLLQTPMPQGQMAYFFLERTASNTCSCGKKRHKRPILSPTSDG